MIRVCSSQIISLLRSVIVNDNIISVSFHSLCNNNKNFGQYYRYSSAPFNGSLIYKLFAFFCRWINVSLVNKCFYYSISCIDSQIMFNYVTYSHFFINGF